MRVPPNPYPSAHQTKPELTWQQHVHCQNTVSIYFSRSKVLCLFVTLGLQVLCYPVLWRMLVWTESLRNGQAIGSVRQLFLLAGWLSALRKEWGLPGRCWRWKYGLRLSGMWEIKCADRYYKVRRLCQSATVQDNPSIKNQAAGTSQNGEESHPSPLIILWC